ncbi:MAG: phosphoribosylglycinamide formyltransferase-1 [Psychromonas sp.]|jgi:phosphoribosylglycinamide formyltransferase-1
MIKKRIAIFASGAGTNALNLINFFSNHSRIEVSLLISNKKNAPVIKNAEKLGVNVLSLDNEKVSKGEVLVDVCQNQGIDYIVLAGYLRKVPEELIAEYNEKIINLHPSLLPKHGGKGMYGMNVHEAVKSNKDEISGITIHLVNQEYDKGRFLAQFFTDIKPDNSPEDIAKKVQVLEHSYFPVVVEQYINQQI